MDITGNAFQEIAPGLFFVPAGGNGGFPYCHSLALDGDLRVLIDAGFATDKTIESANGWRPDRVFVSHAHPTTWRPFGPFPTPRSGAPSNAPTSSGVSNP